MDTELRAEREEHEFAAWRREQLLRCGFTPQAARQIAADARYDLHALIELTERGCAPELAERILAPLEGGAAAA
jgi:hypothetical protein